MNKKGKVFPQFGYFMIFIIAILIFMFVTGGLSSFILKETFKNVPAWFWIGLVLFILIILGRRKNG